LQHQEKIRQLEQLVQKGLDEAAQNQERSDSAVADMMDAKKEVEAMKVELEAANEKVPFSPMMDRATDGKRLSFRKRCQRCQVWLYRSFVENQEK
jgi:hypothetical protein